MRRFLILCLLLCLPWVAEAKSDCTAGYVPPDALDPLLLPPPPKEGSPAWRKDLQTVIQAQRHTTNADLVALGEEARLTVDYLLRPYGAAASRAALPQVYAMLDRVKLTADCVNDTAKYYWNTRRPFVAAPDRVRLKVAPFQSPSYPSGHTMESRVLAEVLGMLWPDRRAEFRTAADRIAWHRVQAGAHYPHDLEGGRLQAMQLVGALVVNQDFANDLAIARAKLND